jgi:uncharacterized protein (DUF488 family)
MELSRVRVYTVGYEKRTLDDLCSVLVANGVRLVVDVRLTPWSRRPGFAKNALERRLAESGVSYRHEPRLGNPRDNREPFWNGDVERGRRRFRKVLSNGSASALHALGDTLRHTPTAIMCVEREEARCHRQVIVEALAEANPRLKFTRL